ncbi:MAG: hypothetical protein KC550_01050 [Nanoarchaeota archaeon]|nr:hypothetical protein [Nanoarchaeota archaeon]
MWSKRKVIEVLDGDTVQFANGDYGRLAGVRAPEKNHKLYSTAKRVLAGMISRDNWEVNCKVVGTSYNRLVVELSNFEGSINQRMKAKGFTHYGN